MSAQDACHVTVVLLCLGRGGDPNSFQPNRDESQWWSRRDALVRCVASFLFGPSPPTREGNKDMILIFDDDWAQMHLSFHGNVNTIPTEHTILSLFKKAAQSLGTVVSQGGLHCRIMVDPTHGVDIRAANSNLTLPNGLDSKRQVLEYLQKKCSMDFLRANGLNSNPAVILRKTNKKALMEVWNKWRRHVNDQGNSPKSGSNQSAIIEGIYSEIVERSKKDDGSDGTTIAATLHETCEEFPCFQPQECSNASKSLRVIFFLGAVRDMTSQENRTLEKVCKALNIPLVGVRFGTVVEFTSKILSVLALHHSHPQIMRYAMTRLLSDPGSNAQAVIVPPRRATCLHIICTVPMDSVRLSADLGQRDRIHWCIVRVVVCGLWRSKLASSDASSTLGHINTLTFVFDDGVVLRLSEGEFVSKLASQHQAAPSEHQILSALRELLDAQGPPTDGWSNKALSNKVVEQTNHSSSLPATLTISLSPGTSDSLSSNFYSGKGSADGIMHDAVIAILDIQKTNLDTLEGRRKNRKIHTSILRASEKLNIPTFAASPVLNAGDYEAASITCLQHFLYQNRLLVKNASATSGTKRKQGD